jgi:hypothetical protein
LLAQKISLNLEPHFFFDNTEYVDSYAESETLFGTSLKSFFTFYQSERLTFNLGIYGIYFYGEEDFLSDVKPLASYTYNLEDAFFFTMGYLDNNNRHDMLEALQRKQLEYTRQIEYGFQIGLKNTYSTFDFWLNWNLLNTPEHSEYLNLGSNLFIYVRNFIFNIQVYWSHHGGKLYKVGPITHNYSLASGLENYYEFKYPIFNTIGYKLYFLGDYDETEANADKNGYGLYGELYLYLFTFKLYLDYWTGHNFISEEGSPLYRHKEWIMWGMRNETSISDKTDFSIELRLNHINDTNVFSYEYRFELRTYLGYKIKP